MPRKGAHATRRRPARLLADPGRLRAGGIRPRTQVSGGDGGVLDEGAHAVGDPARCRPRHPQGTRQARRRRHDVELDTGRGRTGPLSGPRPEQRQGLLHARQHELRLLRHVGPDHHRRDEPRVDRRALHHGRAKQGCDELHVRARLLRRHRTQGQVDLGRPGLHGRVAGEWELRVRLRRREGGPGPEQRRPRRTSRRWRRSRRHGRCTSTTTSRSTPHGSPRTDIPPRAPSTGRACTSATPPSSTGTAARWASAAT